MNTIIISASLVIFATIIGLYYMYKDNHQEQPLWSFSLLCGCNFLHSKDRRSLFITPKTDLTGGQT